MRLVPLQVNHRFHYFHCLRFHMLVLERMKRRESHRSCYFQKMLERVERRESYRSCYFPMRGCCMNWRCYLMD